MLHSWQRKTKDDWFFISKPSSETLARPWCKLRSKCGRTRRNFWHHQLMMDNVSLSQGRRKQTSELKRTGRSDKNYMHPNNTLFSNRALAWVYTEIQWDLKSAKNWKSETWRQKRNAPRTRAGYRKLDINTDPGKRNLRNETPNLGINTTLLQWDNDIIELIQSTLLVAFLSKQLFQLHALTSQSGKETRLSSHCKWTIDCIQVGWRGMLGWNTFNKLDWFLIQSF